MTAKSPPFPPLAILAGGLASRMGDLTKTIPKAMLEVADAPFISHQLEVARREGFRRIVLCVGHLSEVLEDYLGDGSRFGLDIHFSHDGDQLLGTGGALRKAIPLLGREFGVLYGDSYLDTDYEAPLRAFRASGLPALMTVFRNEDRWDTSNVLFRSGRILRYDKMSPTPDMQHIDYGLGFLRAETLEAWADNSVFDLSEVYLSLANEGRLAGYEVPDRFFEIGSKRGLDETDSHLRHRTPSDGTD